MTEAFILILKRNFAKTAGVASTLFTSPGARRFWSGTGQTAVGAGAGVGIAKLEDAAMERSGFNVGPLGSTGSMILNTLTGASIGNPALRRGMYHYKDPISGRPQLGKGSLSPARLGMGVTAKALLPVPVYAGDQVAQMLSKTNNTLGSGQDMVNNVSDKVTGVRPGEDEYSAAARRLIEKQRDVDLKAEQKKLQAANPAAAPAAAPGKTRAQIGAEKALEKYTKDHPDQSDWIQQSKDRLTKGLPDSIEKSVANRDLGASAEKIVGNIDEASSNVKDVSGSLKGVTDTLSKLKPEEIKQSVNELSGKLDPFSKFMENMNENGGRYLRNAGMVAGGAALTYGGYNLVRDWLNHRRQKALVGMKMQPKLAGVSPALGRILGGTMGGALSYTVGSQAGLPSGQLAGNTAIGVISGGMAGRGVAAHMQTHGGGPGSFGRAIAANAKPLAVSAANDMALGPALHYMHTGTEANKAMVEKAHSDIATQKHDMAMQDQAAEGSPWSTGAKWIGGGALGLAGLAALLQVSRAAKRVGDGEPLMKSENTVFTGAGGPENPNVGGRLQVHLPTKKPGDQETTVDIPMENVPLPHSLIRKIQRDTKRRLRTESNYRTTHIGAGDGQVQKIFNVT